MPISYRAAQTLIKRGDEPGLRAALEAGLDPNLANPNGWSLLMLAAVEGDVPIGKLLLERGANITASNNKNETALSIATNRGYDLFVALLSVAK
jgi:ankyrin repeat protein